MRRLIVILAAVAGLTALGVGTAFAGGNHDGPDEPDCPVVYSLSGGNHHQDKDDCEEECPPVEASMALMGGNHDKPKDDCEEPVDVCPNIEGDQATVPDGLVVDEEGNCVEEPPPPTNPPVTVDSVCDVGVVFSWSNGLEHRVLSVDDFGSFLAQAEMDQVNNLTVPFGGPYRVVILNVGGDEFVEEELTELDGEYPEPAECSTPPTTTPPTTPPTEPPTEPTTPPTQPPATPTTEAPAPDGDTGTSVPWQLPVGFGAVALTTLLGLSLRGRKETS